MPRRHNPPIAPSPEAAIGRERAMVRLRRALPTALIYAVVVLTLDAQSIWWDEGISLHLASLPWREILSDRAANIHPPLYFLLLKVWGAVVGLNPFSGRYLSALSVTLLPACVHRYVGRRAGSLAGRVAAVLVSIAPPFIIYGQEARAYALLPLGILGLWSLAWPVDASRPGRGGVVGPVLPLGRSRWVALGLVQATLLLTHYAGAVACAVAALAYGFRAARAPRGHPRHHVVREWVQGATLAAILMLPWVLIVARTGLEGMARQAGLASASADPVAAVYVAGLLGVFHTTGLPAALADRLLVRPSLIVGLLLAAAALWGALRVRRRAVLGASLLLWLVPLASAPLIWALSPQSHPRYLYPFVLGGWTTTAIVIGERRVPRLLRAGLLAAALSTSLLGIRGYFTRPS
ncbi:MAG: glycosyltransferase family 39 protein, partial [Anaerolineae bacterium]|nr:glycosyltransferase family 39 protein [Anaerolineae bacterium]